MGWCDGASEAQNIWAPPSYISGLGLEQDRTTSSSKHPPGSPRVLLYHRPQSCWMCTSLLWLRQDTLGRPRTESLRWASWCLQSSDTLLHGAARGEGVPTLLALISFLFHTCLAPIPGWGGMDQD